MITEVVPVDSVNGELDMLLHDYWKKTNAHVDMPQLAMDWKTFSALEKLGKFVVIVARRDENAPICGFAMYYILRHQHHRTTTFAICDILAVKLSERGAGVGRRIMHDAENVLRKRSVQRIIHGFRTVYDVEPLFEKLGYKLFERNYMKVL